MQTQNTERVHGPKPQLDAETHELVQELFALARSGDAARIEGLLEMGLVPNLRDSSGNSLLMLACYHGHLPLATVLLEYGADPELRNDREQSPLAGAAYKGDLPMVQRLLDAGAQVDGRSPGGKSPLMFAAMFNRTAIIECLLKAGADPNLRTDDGYTAADLAVAMGAEESIAALGPINSQCFPRRLARSSALTRFHTKGGSQ